MSSGDGEMGPAERLLAEARAEMARLRVVRGSTPRHIQRRRRKIRSLVALAVGLSGVPLGPPARALIEPGFLPPPRFPFGLSETQGLSAPELADIDGDGDLDAFMGDDDEDTNLFFRNTGTVASPVFAEPSTTFFGHTTTIYYSPPSMADIDGDGDLDAFFADFDKTLFFLNTGTATAPDFASPSTDPFGLASVGDELTPEFADIDGDGDLDAFFGENGGAVFFFRNTGAVGSPAFDGPTDSAFGLFGTGGRSAPDLSDIDGDGDLDALVGAADGSTSFFRNTGDVSSPAFAAPSTNAFGLTDVQNESKPDLGDIDGDGDLDAFIGSQDGTTQFFRNTGTASTPAFLAPAPEPFGSINVGTRVRPDLVDIDADGDLDLFVGTQTGALVFNRNTGTSSSPALGGPSTNPFGLADVATSPAPDFADIDGDGDLDAFVGRADGIVVFFANTGTSIAPAFASPTTNPFGLSSALSDVTPEFADTDADGDLDAFIGGSSGQTVYYENTGSASSPAFDTPNANALLLGDVGTSSAPELADVDADGDLDALVGAESGSMAVARNTGAATPTFDAPMTDPFGFFDIGTRSAPAAGDIDDDGDLDVLVGTGNGRVWLFRNSSDDTRMRITNVTMTEGDSGKTLFVFTIKRDGDVSAPATVKVKVASGTAKIDKDVLQIPRKKRKITFAAGETSKTVTVKVIGDTKLEPNESFTVNLSNPTGATIVDGSGTGAITNDD